MLQRALPIQKVEEFVLDDRPAQAPAVLGALKGLSKSRRRGQRGSQGAVAEQTESFAMNGIGSRTRGHIDRSGSRQFRRKIHARLAKLEFLDAAGGDVRSGRAEYLVRDVDAINFNPSSAAETATEGDGGIAVLTEVRSVLDLDARLQLCQVQEIAPIDWQVINLVGIQDALHARLFRVDPHGGALHIDNLILLPD